MFTALLNQIYNGNIDSFHELMDLYQPNVNSISRRYKIGLLHAAAEAGRLPFVKFLINREGADVNLVISSRGPPLSFAVRNNHIHIIRYLIRRGAEIDLDSFLTPSPWRTAVMYANYDTIEVLLEYIPLEEPNYLLHDSMRHVLERGDVDIFELIVEKGNLDLDYGLIEYDINNGDLVPSTASMLEFLKSKGVKVDYKGEAGRHLYARAKEKGNISLMKYILKEFKSAV